MLKKLSDGPYLGLIVGILVFGLFGVVLAAYNAGRESVRQSLQRDRQPKMVVDHEQQSRIDKYIADYARDPHETIFQNCLGDVPKDDVVGETYPLSRRMRFAKSAYDWSFIEMETDVDTDKRFFEIEFSLWVWSSPFPYLKGKPGEISKLQTFALWPEEDKYKPGTDGRIEWLVTPKVEFGRKTLTLQFRCVR